MQELGRLVYRTPSRRAREEQRRQLNLLKEVYGMPPDRLEVRVKAKAPAFKVRAYNPDEARKAREERAREQGLDPFAFDLRRPVLGDERFKEVELSLCYFFIDIAQGERQLGFLEAYSTQHKEEPKKHRGKKDRHKAAEDDEEPALVDVYWNVIVFQRGIIGAIPGSVKAYIKVLEGSSHALSTVYANRNFDIAKQTYWRGDAIVASAATSLSHTAKLLRINDYEGNYNYALEASNLSSKQAKRKERTFEEFVELAIERAKQSGNPALFLKGWRNPEVRMAAASTLGLNPERYRHCAVDDTKDKGK